ncbi:L,D-transpeptidase family protein [Acidovorax sp. NCPPB 4044]|uniref:L,D-transpeptidase family protein n=1 Tax=Acidovorax sp. NCPPB 4044 TaxID=2940490 RepID=UPI0023033900|nr:L,D-transpeptidase family protein [Acidovorax sp. NCPPB 4044]MDA8521374.1 L,D-transpeptidase family protein [Acidovorax sp. NCPPB 4044]
MPVAIPLRSRAVAAAAALSVFCGMVPTGAHAQGDKERAVARAKRSQSKAPARAQPAPLRDGQAEQRLMEVYRLTGEGRGREALAKAESLVRDYPHFQLAQLTLGDLLSARTRPLRQLGDVPAGQGDAPQPPTPTAAEVLAELRAESRQRTDALRIRPGARAIPAQFLELSPRSRHAIAVDASRSRLYLFQNTDQGLELIADYYASVGKLGIEKSLEGDQRTPLGVYFITSRLDPATLKDFYGAGALPINYPNPLDLSRGKTGSGIWLHGTPSEQFSRAPLSTDGCLALANPDLERILRTVEPRSTPVLIARQIQWVQPQAVLGERRQFENVLDAWRTAKSQGDVRRLMSFYAPGFQSYGKMQLADYAKSLEAETRALRGRPLHLKDRSLLRWTDASDTMVVTFGEVAEGARTGPVKRQYWMRKGQQWQIFFEGVIG